MLSTKSNILGIIPHLSNKVSPGSEKERALADDIGTMELCHVALQRLDFKKIWNWSAVLSEVDGLAVA